eukprot:TRINITY_DN988_c0_g1_i1.p1 TRINITY_DN988_c0_g1~~TRINITY_DN988_c0_g1_i1.p1  ORF type:complete len:623 (-),score=76.21 TRINITY_DN988_c0_g1_i1:1109-2977(-)
MRFGGGRGRGRGRSRARRAFYDNNDAPQQKSIADRASAEILGDGSSLRAAIKSINRSSYPAYKSLRGVWQLFPSVTMHVDRVQSDPYAPPSRFRARIPLADSKFPPDLYRSSVRTVAFGDFLTRKFAQSASEVGDSRFRDPVWNSLKGGDISIDRPSQHVLYRSSCVVVQEQLEVRFCVGLPARGRKIDGKAAESVLFDVLPQILKHVLFADESDANHLRRHVESIEQQQALRDMLPEKGLIAFVIDGAILPRLSGASDKPLRESDVIKFKSPPSLRVSFTLPGGKVVSGMGLKPGVSLIVGGGFHGKSTLLSALQVGVYNHIPGDGREFVAVHEKAMSIRAEDGRSVTGVDISPFINNLPFGKRTDMFSTPDASGSTSQATNIIEAIEAGAKLLLIDEDLTATNFMIRDHRMQELVPDTKEPITPMIKRIRTLHEKEGISTILVVGAAGDYFAVSDLVLMMDSYSPKNVTEAAKQIASKGPAITNLSLSHPDIFKRRRKRRASRSSLRGFLQSKRIQVKERTVIHFGTTNIDLSAVSQIVEKSQTRAIAAMLDRICEVDELENEDITSAIEKLENDIDQDGIDTINSQGHLLGNYARPRGLEVQAALNRIRGFKLLESDKT